MTRTWIGIDPGFDGAIGVINDVGEMVYIWDMPLHVKKFKKQKRQVDSMALNEIFWKLSLSVMPKIFLEWPTTRPDEAAEASKNFGIGLGLLQGFAEAWRIDFDRVAPNKWKADLGLPGKKSRRVSSLEARRMSCEQAIVLIPNVEKSMVYGPRGGALDGRAEALLIAWHAWSKTLPAMRTLRERYVGSAYDDTRSMAHMLMAGRRPHKVKTGRPLF